MLRTSLGLALALALLTGCENGREDAHEKLSTPSEGAPVENQTPGADTVDISKSAGNDAGTTDATLPPAADATAQGTTDTSATPATTGDTASPVPAPSETTAPTGGDKGNNAGDKTLNDADAAAKGGETPKS
jgi:hypothetical protein